MSDTPKLQQAADGGCPPATCSRLITQAELENVLTHEGLVAYNAIEDPFGYDNGNTELAVSVAARVLDEIARQKTAHLIEALEAADEFYIRGQAAYPPLSSLTL